MNFIFTSPSCTHYFQDVKSGETFILENDDNDTSPIVWLRIFDVQDVGIGYLNVVCLEDGHLEYFLPETRVRFLEADLYLK